jgi:lipoprotein-anchoring transpeptidase ErfK/SrfK
MSSSGIASDALAAITLLRVRRGVAIVASTLACLLAGLFSAAVLASNGPLGAPTTTTTTGTTTAPVVELVPAGVFVGKVEVGGLTPAAASILVKTEFDEPLPLRFGHRTILVTPQRLGATARIRLAIDQARRAAPNTRIPLFVTLRPGGVSRYVKALARRFDKPARNAELTGLRNLRPWITKEQVGKALRQRPAVRAIVAALRTHRRMPARIRAARVDPLVTRAGYGPIIVIRRESKNLYLYRGMRLWKRLGVATGTSEFPTPIGNFAIATMQRHPWWYPPASDWAKGEKPIPPGPGNPLGTRWMGLTAPLVGIHGTPDAASIGYSASHGCIRMRIPEAEWLFTRVTVGTPVHIVRA